MSLDEQIGQLVFSIKVADLKGGHVALARSLKLNVVILCTGVPTHVVHPSNG